MRNFLISVLTVIVTGCSGGISSKNNSAAADMVTDILLLECGDRTFYQGGIGSVGELDGVSTRVEEKELTPADRANGVEWSATVHIDASMRRQTYYGTDSNGKRAHVWRKWENGGPTPFFAYVALVNGELRLQPSRRPSFPNPEESCAAMTSYEEE